MSSTLPSLINSKKTIQKEENLDDILDYIDS
jgi:hypothetical protein